MNTVDCDAHEPSPLGTWLLEERRPANWTELSRRLSVVVGQRGDKPLRLKGLIYCVEDSRPLAIHGVQRLFHTPLKLGRWISVPKTTIVIIGDVGARSAIEDVRDALQNSIVENQPRVLKAAA